MVEDTESPRIFHVACAIGAVSIALGRRCFVQFGDKQIFPNQYIVLVGTPATRKSSALNHALKLVEDCTKAKLAPDDTAGQRQGLISAMLKQSKHKQLFLDGQELTDRDDDLQSLTVSELARITDQIMDEESEGEDGEPFEVDNADREHLVAVSDEFSQLVGENSSTLLTFLTTVYDGRRYRYQLKSDTTVLKKPLLNILAATTPVNLARSMPKSVNGSGLLSRVILVYGGKKYKSIPWPLAPNPDLVDVIRTRLSDISDRFTGEFEVSELARQAFAKLYAMPSTITDSRFIYYHERRHMHLMKMAIALAAMNERQELIAEDFNEANKILRAIERGMPDALGEFGMNPLASLKQAVLEFMRDAATMSIEELRGHFHRDSRSNEFMEVLHDLIKQGQLTLHVTQQGRQHVSAKFGKYATDDEIFKLLSEGNDNGY